MQTKSCQNCSKNFKIQEKDLHFYQKINILPPTFCQDCRQQRRLAYRNERKFYKRLCALTSKEIISIYSPDKDCVVYDQTKWWSDEWDPLEYGQDYDFNRPFFDQYFELSKKVPRPSLINMSSENSLYTNHSAYNKNCYMCINTGYSEDCYHVSNYSIYNKDCVDCLAIQHCELCYFCTDSQKCSFSTFLDECRNCTDSHYCYDCHSCQNCFGCFNLHNKKFHIFNQPCSKEEYHQKLEELNPKTWEESTDLFQKFTKEVSENAIHKFARIQNCENSSGDHLLNNKNVTDSFYTFGSQDCAYCYDAGEMKDSYDSTEPYKGELNYEVHGCNINHTCVCCSKCYENDNISYSQYCWYSSNIFGCFGLKRKEHCILNKQYSKEEYQKRLPQIIEHMTQTKEWGQFFPAKLSPFAYNETAAQEYYPLTAETALEKGYGWISQHQNSSPQNQTAQNCTKCQKQFIIIPQEQNFYKKQKLPLPKICPDCRHYLRFNLRPPRKTAPRACSKCQTQVKSPYSNKKAKKILCEKCYLEKVF